MEDSSIMETLAGPTSEAWELYQSTITRLYLDDKKTLPQIMDVMQKQFGFRASTKMYKTRFALWKIDSKNLKRKDVKQIARIKVARDAAGKQSAFKLKGREITLGNIQRYLKKHRMPSLEDLAGSASPLAENRDVRCYTPAQSPDVRSCCVLQRNYLANTNVPDSLSQVQISPYGDDDADSLTWMTSLGHAGSPVVRRPEEHQMLSISQVTQSKRLSSLNSGLYSHLLLSTWTIAEEALWTVNSFLRSGFENGKWATGLDVRSTLPGKGRWNSPNIFNGCYSALQMVRQGKYIQGRQLLSRECAILHEKLRYAGPDLLSALLDTHYFLHRTGDHGLLSLLLTNNAESAELILGRSHPLTRLFRLSVYIKKEDLDVYVQMSRCITDVLVGKLGPLHHETLRSRAALLQSFDTEQAVCESKALLATCEQKCAPGDARTLQSALFLATSLCRNKDYQEAKDIAFVILNTLETTPQASELRSVKVYTLALLSKIAFAQEDLNSAEYFIKICAHDEVLGQFLDQGVTIRYLNVHLGVLRAIGRQREAEEVEQKIEKILGPPEIVELLE